MRETEWSARYEVRTTTAMRSYSFVKFANGARHYSPHVYLVGHGTRVPKRLRRASPAPSAATQSMASSITPD